MMHVRSTLVVQVVGGEPATFAYTVYEVMGEPLSLGASHLTVSVPSPAVTIGAPGRSGTPEGVTEFDVAPLDSPEAFTAFTVKV